MPFTDRQVSGFKPKGARYEKKEPGRTGLRIRVNADGSKTWAFTYRFAGRQKRMVLGHYPEMGVSKAHKALADAKDKLRAGTDPGAVVAEERKAEREAETFAELVEDYITRHVTPNMKPNTAKEEARILHRDCVPILGHLKAKDVRRRDLVKVLDAIEERGACVQRNRTAGVFSRLFKFAIKRGIVETSPALYLHEKRFDNPNGRDRVLSMQEIHDLWHGLDRASLFPSTALAVRFLICTGQRRSECAEAVRSEIDDEAALWTLPADRTKNGRENYIPLPPFVMALVKEADKLRNDTPALFTSRFKTKQLRGETLTRIFNRERKILKVGDATIHDIRRTFATVHGSIGTPPEVISALLNHTPQHITGKIYNRAPLLEQRRAAMERYCEYLQLVIAGEFEAAKKMHGADVVHMDRAVA